MRQLAEPIDITGRTVMLLKVAASVGVALMFATFAVVIHLSRLDVPYGGSTFAIAFGMLILTLAVVKAASAVFSRSVFDAAPVPDRTQFEGSLFISKTTLLKWGPALFPLLFIWIAGDLGPPLVASAITMAYGSLVWVWALGAKVTAIDPRRLSQDELEAQRRLSTRVRREANMLLSQWFSALSMGLAIALVLSAAAAIVAPRRLHMWRWALLFALAYVIVGSLLRAAAETRNKLWVDIDVVRLWKVSRKTSLLAAAVAGIGAAIGALVGCFVWLSSDLSAGGEALDMVGRWVTAGTALGAVAGVLTLPKLAFVRRRELRRADRTLDT